MKYELTRVSGLPVDDKLLIDDLKNVSRIIN